MESEDLLKKALDECLSEEVNAGITEEAIARNPHFSEAFQKNMEELFKSQGQKAVQKRRFWRIGKWAALLFVCLLVGAWALLSPKKNQQTAMLRMIEEAGAQELATAMAADGKEKSRLMPSLVLEPAQVEEQDGAYYLTVRMMNQGEQAIEIQAAFSLEQRVGNDWASVPGTGSVPAAAGGGDRVLPANTTKEMVFNLSGYPLREEIRYRILIEAEGNLFEVEFDLSEGMEE